MFTPTKGDFAGKSLVKRVIAVGGDHVQITESAVFLNGEKLDEPYVNPAEIAIYSQPLDFYVQDGYVFCMGDNRNHSTDCAFRPGERRHDSRQMFFDKRT